MHTGHNVQYEDYHEHPEQHPEELARARAARLDAKREIPPLSPWVERRSRPEPGIGFGPSDEARGARGERRRPTAPRRRPSAQEQRDHEVLGAQEARCRGEEPEERSAPRAPAAAEWQREHRAHGDEEENSFMMNWTSRMARDFQGLQQLEEALMAPTGKLVAEGIIRGTPHLTAQQELLHEEDQEKREEQRKRQRKKQKKIKKKKKNTTINRILQAGAAHMIQTWVRRRILPRFRRRRMCASRIQRWFHTASRVRDLKRNLCQLLVVRRQLMPCVLSDIRVLGPLRFHDTARKIQRVVRHWLRLRAKHQQIVDTWDWRLAVMHMRRKSVFDAWRQLNCMASDFNRYMNYVQGQLAWIRRLRKQMEWFMVENLANDEFLQGYVCPVTFGVPLTLIMGFPTMQTILHENVIPNHVQACVQAAALSQKLQIYFDPSGTIPMIRGLVFFPSPSEFPSE